MVTCSEKFITRLQVVKLLDSRISAKDREKLSFLLSDVDVAQGTDSEDPEHDTEIVRDDYFEEWAVKDQEELPDGIKKNHPMFKYVDWVQWVTDLQANCWRPIGFDGETYWVREM